MEWLSRAAHFFIIEALVVIGLLDGAVQDVHLNKDDRTVCGAEHGNECFREIEPWIRPESCVPCDHGINLELGPTEDVAEEVTPDRILAYSSGALLDDVCPDLEEVLD